MRLPFCVLVGNFFARHLVYRAVKRTPKMDQNNMNKFFNSSFFAQTPQKDNKQGMLPSNQQSVFGQSQPVFGTSGQQAPFMQNTGDANKGLNANLFGKPTFGSVPSFGSTSQPMQSTGNAFGSSFSSQQPSVNKFGASNTFGNTNTFGTTNNTLGTTTLPFGATGSSNALGANTFGSGLQSNTSTQPFSTGTSTQQNAWGQPTATQYPFATGQNSFLGDRSNVLNRPAFPGYGASIGTKDHPYIQRKVREDNGSEVILVHINGNENYSGKSVEELRHEDYSLGRKPITTGNANTTETKPFGFGSNTGIGNTSVSVDNRSGMGIFGSTPTATSFQPLPSAPQSNFGLQKPPTSLPSQQPLFSQPSNVTTTNPLQPRQTPEVPSTGFPFPSSVQQPSFTSFQPSFSIPQQSTVQTQQPMFGNVPGPSNFVDQPIHPQQTSIDPSDPFLLKDIKFEKVEKEHIPLSKMFPQPIFKEEPKVKKISLSFRPPKSPAKDKVYTIPPIEDLKHMKEVHNLVIGFEDKGRIEYLDAVNTSEVTMNNIQSKIYFSKESVVVNDPAGVGLNKRARVYVEGVFPYSRSLGDYIRGEQKQFPLKGIQERFVYGLKNDAVKKFVGYEYERGTYVYDVNHF